MKNIGNGRKSAILLTGGCGYIGVHCLLELLSNRNEDIIIVDNLSNSTIDNMDKIRDIGNVTFYNIDITNEENMMDVFNKHNISTVMHFAGYKSVSKSVENHLKYYNNNIGGLLVLLNCMKENKVNKIIFSSSATVYGNPKSLPITEKDEIDILNPYGRTKYISEEILKDISNSDKNFKSVILRYFNPVANHHLLKENSKFVTNLFPVIMSVINGDREYLKIFGKDYVTNDGTAIRDYIHVVDLAKGHLAALNYIDKMENHFEVFNLGTGKGYSVLEVVNSFTRILNEPFLKYKSFNYKFEERREGDAAEVYADCKKAKEILNWEARLTLEDMVHDCLN